MEIRKTKLKDLDKILAIYDSARKFMENSGNQNQWIGGYPQKEVILLDIENNQHYVCVDNDNVVGCFALIEGNDPTYGIIEDGNWLNDLPYTALHRLATYEQSKGVGSFCVKWCTQQQKNIKADTHENNLAMKNLLLKNGFQICGTIFNRWGDKRLAFQKE